VRRTPFSEPTHLIETTVRLKKLIPPFDQKEIQIEPLDNLRTIETCLRLLKSGGVSQGAFVFEEGSYWLNKGNQTGTGVNLFDFPGYLFPPSYELLEQDVPRLRAIFLQLSKIEGATSDSVGVALRRFNSVYQRRLAEDKLVDLIVALEALFLKNTEQQEMSYRLALRALAILSRRELRNPNTAENIKAAYDIRSSIVHGSRSREITKKLSQISKRENASITLENFESLIENYVRQLILDFIAKRKLVSSDEKLIQQLDEKIIKAASNRG
jgi:hypothetical protein